jgi:uroporphyrinogen III methyltransferase/synthase
VVQFPTIEIAAPESFESLDRAVNEPWDWLIFTSVNGVEAFFGRTTKDTRALAATKIAAVGEPTSAALRRHGIVPDLVPEKFQSISLLPHFPDDMRGTRVALVRAQEGRDEVFDELRRRGAEVLLAVAYRTVPVTANAGELHDVDVVTFTSASTVDNFFAAVPDATKLNGALLASIGPTTSEAIRKHGRQPDVEASNASVQALHDAVVQRLAR